MRKTICTASVFVVLVGLSVALFAVKVPDSVWWNQALGGSGTEPLIWWLFPNVIGVAAVGWITVWLIQALWWASAAICAKLRGETKA